MLILVSCVVLLNVLWPLWSHVVAVRPQQPDEAFIKVNLTANLLG